MRNTILVSLAFASAACASSVVTFLTPGAGVDLLPISTSSVAGDEFQEVYSASQFGSSPVTLYALAFSSSATVAGDATTLSGDASITLSTTSTLTPGAPGTWSVANEGGDATTVFNGTFSTPVLHNSTFDLVFSFATPFTFDPSAGNLLMDFDWVSTPSTDGFIALSASYSSALVGSNSDTSLYGNFGAANTGVATQFSETPEPATWFLMGFSLLVCAVVRSWKTKATQIVSH